MSSTLDSDAATLLTRLGYHNPVRVTRTIQGSIWKCSKQIVGANNSVISSKRVIKITKEQNISTTSNDKHNKINENILNEISILKYLTQDNTESTTIVKYIDFFRRYSELHFCILKYNNTDYKRYTAILTII